MWADALDRMLARIARTAEIDVENIRAIAGSAQQHGSVYLNRRAADVWRGVDPLQPLAPQLQGMFSRDRSPVWMDATTAAQCREIDAALGGPDRTKALTGSPACERFTGPQIRRFFQQQPDAYARDRARASRQLVPGVPAHRRRRADRSGRRIRHEPDGPRAQSLVSRSARRDRPGLAAAAAAARADMGARRPARAVLAAALHAAGGRGAGVDRRQPFEPDRHRHHSRSRRRRLARHERHGVCADARSRPASRRTCSDRRPATS